MAERFIASPEQTPKARPSASSFDESLRRMDLVGNEDAFAIAIAQRAALVEQIGKCRSTADLGILDRLNSLWGRHAPRVSSALAVMAATSGLPGCTETFVNSAETALPRSALQALRPSAEAEQSSQQEFVNPWKGMPDEAGMVEEMRKHFPESTVASFLAYAKKHDADLSRKKEKITERTGVSGFGEQLNLPDIRIAQLITSTFPAPFTDARALSQIRITSESPSFMASEPKKGIRMVTGESVKAETRLPDASGPGEITIQVNAEEEDQVLGTLERSFAYANDWVTSPHLNARERLTLCYALMERVQEPTRIKFPNEQPAHSNGTGAEQMEQSMRTYWANLMQMGFQTPGADGAQWVNQMFLRASSLASEGSELPSADADIELLLWYFRAVDPQFKPWQANARRINMATTLMHESIGAELETAVHTLPAGIPKTILMNALSGDYSEDDRIRFLILQDPQIVERVSTDEKELLSAFVRAYVRHQQEQLDTLEAEHAECAVAGRAFVQAYSIIVQWHISDKQQLPLTDPGALPYVQGLISALKRFGQVQGSLAPQNQKHALQMLPGYVAILNGNTGSETPLPESFRGLFAGLVNDPDRFAQ